MTFSHELGYLPASTYTGIYAMHKYWAKKPYNIVRAYIERFTKLGEIVLDMFSGSGVTAIEALRTRRKAVAIDLNPMATFITRMSVMPVEINRLRMEFNLLRTRVKDRIDELYETICRNCGRKVIASHIIRRRGSSVFEEGTPIEIRYRCAYCKPTEVQMHPPLLEDFNKLKEIERMEIPYYYPDSELIENTRVNVYRGMRIPHLFTKRNLIALSILFNELCKIEDNVIRDLMKFTFTASLPQSSRMVFVIRRRGLMKGRVMNKAKGEVGSWVAGYWIPEEYFEINVWNSFENRFEKIRRGKRESNLSIGNYCKEATNFKDLIEGRATILNLTYSATDLSNILPKESIDYIFTDPPHGDDVPYLEVSKMWCDWLGFKLDFEKEIIVSDSKARSKGFNEYKKGLSLAFKEAGRVLKPGKFMTVTFHHSDLKIWDAFISACKEAGFKVVDVKSVRASAPSVIQDSRRHALKTDLYVTFQKVGNIVTYPTQSSIDVNKLIIDVIERLVTVRGAFTYEIYDAVIAELIKNDVLREEINLHKILSENFKFIDGKWYKKS